MKIKITILLCMISFCCVSYAQKDTYRKVPGQVLATESFVRDSAFFAGYSFMFAEPIFALESVTIRIDSSYLHKIDKCHFFMNLTPMHFHRIDSTTIITKELRFDFEPTNMLRDTNTLLFKFDFKSGQEFTLDQNELDLIGVRIADRVIKKKKIGKRI